MTAETIAGEIKINHFLGEIRAKSTSGDVKINSATGKLNVRSISGDVTLERHRGEKAISTTSGDVRVEGKFLPSLGFEKTALKIFGAKYKPKVKILN